MKTTRLIIITCMCFTLSCICIPRSLRKALIYHHTGAYTGIDTLINIDGYYRFIYPFIFYDNGLVATPTGTHSEDIYREEFAFLEEINKNPTTKDAMIFYNNTDCGSYAIYGDTIKVQLVHKYRSMFNYWDGKEVWFKIISKDTLLFIDRFLLTTNSKEQERFRADYISSHGDNFTLKCPLVPMPIKPSLDYYWILKRKWFWRNEPNRKEYLEKMEQKKKEYKKNVAKER